MSFGLATRRSTLLYILSLIDGEGPASVDLFDTTIPSDSSADPGGDPLASVELAAVSCAIDETLAVLNIIEAVGNAAAAGIPTWARFRNALGVGVGDFTAGPPGSGAVVIVTNGEDPPTAQLFTGGEVNITGTIAFPG
ncbi:MAG: hypothetical protein ACK40L_04925 [Hydrogenophaga sp.]